MNASAVLLPVLLVMQVPLHGSASALIIHSGSTNTQAYTESVQRDGSVLVTVGTAKGTLFNVSSSSAEQLFAALSAAQPLGSLSAPHCLKSVSFGSSLHVRWNGESSPDLSCGGDGRASELRRAVEAVEAQLPRPVLMRKFPQPMATFSPNGH